MGIPDVDKLRSSDLIEVISEHTDIDTINKKLRINYPLKIVKIISIILSVIGVIGAIIGLIVDSPLAQSLPSQNIKKTQSLVPLATTLHLQKSIKTQSLVR